MYSSISFGLSTGFCGIITEPNWVFMFRDHLQLSASLVSLVDEVEGIERWRELSSCLSRALGCIRADAAA